MYKLFLMFLVTPFLLDAQKPDIDLKKTGLKNISEEICECVKKIEEFNKTSIQKNQEIKDCIDPKVVVYQTIAGLQNPEIQEDGSQKIQVSTNPESDIYRKYYRELETYTLRNCEEMKILTGSHNEVQQNSISTDPHAVKFYEEGTDLMQSEKFEKAVKKLKKAVEIDPKFAWAWDHLGLTYRYMGKLDEAIEAYETSLLINPDGPMPAQNLAIVYEYKQDFGKALYYYNRIIERYPENPEGYYGAARMHVFLEEHETAADKGAKAYNLYIIQNSPYRDDAEHLLRVIYTDMKEKGKEDRFLDILKQNNIDIGNE